ncbi:CHC2 zinc finger domain-containing protein [Eubacteriaceae bacterium ES2]|nr:CHC2 zinc finger domain-containing protein [Eubacteriaceae bacterium ES2]
MTNPFEYIRENTNIIEVAQYYGMEINRHKKSLCPFHQDNHESMSFKYGRYRCWACGASGDATDLVCQLFGLDLLDAAKRINADFNLNLDLDGDYQPDFEAIEKRKRERELEKAWNSWVDRTYSEYAAIARGYWQAILNCKPKSEEDFCPEYVEAIHQWEPVNHILDILSRGSPEEKIQLHRHLEEVKQKEC